MAIFDTIRGVVKGFFNPNVKDNKAIIPDNQIDEFDNEELGDLIAPVFREIPPEPKIMEYVKEGTKSWAFIAISAICDELASNDYKLYRRQGKTLEKTNEWVEIEEHPFLDLFEKPNPVQTKEEFLWLLGLFYLAGGEAPILLDSPTNPTTMFLLNPDRLKVIFDEKTIIKEYQYLKSNGQKEVLPADVVLLPKLPSFNSPFRGMSLLKYIAKTLDLDSYIEDYLNIFFFNSAMPTGVLETDKELNDTIVKRLIKQFESRHRGVKNSHKLAVLEKGLKFNNTSFKLNELQAKEMQDMLRDKIFALFRVPKSIVGIVEDVNRANGEMSEVAFCKRAVLPRLIMLQGQINQFLIPKFGDGENIWFEFDDPTPNDKTTNATVYNSYVTSGVMLINEVREELGLDPMDEAEYQRFRDMKTPPQLRENNNNNPQQEQPPKEKPPKEKPPVKEPKKHFHPNPIKINRFKGLKKKAVEEKSKEEKKATIEGVMKDVLKSFIVKGQSFSEQQKENYHNQKIHHSNKLEGEFKEDLGRYFKRLGRLAIQQAKSLTKDNKEVSIDFNDKKEQEIIMELSFPYLADAIENQSALTFALIGKNGVFKSTDDFVKEFIEENTKRYSTSVIMTTNDDIKRIVENWAKEGKTLPELRGMLKEYFDKASINRAEQIARTEISRANGFATLQVYREAQVIGKEWITAHDERTCPSCAYMDRKIIPTKNNFWNKGDTLNTTTEDGKVHSLDFDWGSVGSYPLHPSCRCDLIPIFDESLIPDDPFEYKKNIEAEKLKDMIEKEEQIKEKEIELIKKEEKLNKDIVEFENAKSKDN